VGERGGNFGSEIQETIKGAGCVETKKSDPTPPYVSRLRGIQDEPLRGM